MTTTNAPSPARRRFLKGLFAGAVVSAQATLPGVPLASAQTATPSPVEDYATLIDISACVGCNLLVIRRPEMSLELRIVELETRQAFQDDTIQALNDVVVEQARVIERLQSQMAELIKRYEEMVGQYGSEGEEAPPPHY